MNNWFWKNAQGLTSEPSTLNDLIAAVKRGEIGESTQVSNDGENWKAAADVPALANALGLVVEAEAKNSARNKKSETNWLLIAFLIGSLLLTLLKTFGR